MTTGYSFTLRFAQEPTLKSLHPSIDFDSLSDWEMLETVATIYSKHKDKERGDVYRKTSVYWLMTAGQRIFTQQYPVPYSDMSYDFCVTMIETCDWYQVCKPVIINMPTDYVEQYLLDEVSQLPDFMQGDHFKALSKRADNWGLPVDMLRKVYGK